MFICILCHEVNRHKACGSSRPGSTMPWQHMRDGRASYCGKTKMMNKCLEVTFVALPWLKFGEILEVGVLVEDVLGTSVCSCL